MKNNNETLLNIKQTAQILEVTEKYLKEQLKETNIRKFLKPKAIIWAGAIIAFEAEAVKEFKKEYQDKE